MIITTLQLTEQQVTDLTIELNMLLRNRQLNVEYGERMNDMFRQLVGHDHQYWGVNRR